MEIDSWNNIYTLPDKDGVLYISNYREEITSNKFDFLLSVKSRHVGFISGTAHLESPHVAVFNSPVCDGTLAFKREAEKIIVKENHLDYYHGASINFDGEYRNAFEYHKMNSPKLTTLDKILSYKITILFIIIALVIVPWIGYSPRSGHINFGYNLVFSAPRNAAKIDYLGVLLNVCIATIVGIVLDKTFRLKK